MILSELNFMAIGSMAVFYFLFGGVWYAAAFEKPWINGLRHTEEEHERRKKIFGMALASHFASGLVTTFLIALLFRYLPVTSLTDGLLFGFIFWIAFNFMVDFHSYMFECKRSATSFLVHNLYYAVTYTVIGGVLAIW